MRLFAPPHGRSPGLGCLFTNSILEGEIRDPKVQNLVDEHLQTVEQLFQDALRLAARHGGATGSDVVSSIRATNASAWTADSAASGGTSVTREFAVLLNLLVQGLFVVSRLPDSEQRVADGIRAIRRFLRSVITPLARSAAHPPPARIAPDGLESSGRA